MDIMKKIKTSSTGTKLLALLLVVIMTVSLLPMAVLADLFPVADKASTDTQSSSEDGFDRIIMLDCGRKYFTADWIKALIVEAHEAGYTQLQLNFGNDGLRFLLNDMSFTANGTTYDHDTVVSKVEAGNEAQNSSGDSRWLTEAEMDSIIACANDNGIEIVPMLNLPGHANAILDIFNDAYNANGSDNTLDVANNDAAREIGKAILTKYVNYFASKGCNYFSFGADEYANDVSGTFSFGRLDDTEYANFVTFVNDMAGIIKEAGMTARCFNDGLYYNGRSGNFDTDIQCCYWSSGWGSSVASGGYMVASASTIAAKGHKMINTNGDYYYVLGLKDGNAYKDQFHSNGYTYASGFSNTAFMGSTISNPVGSMFCIWCDDPTFETETEVAANVRPILRAMAARMQNNSIDTISTDTYAGGFNTDGTVNALASSDSGVSADAANTINLTVGETSSSFTVSSNYASISTKDSGIASANVNTVSSNAGYQLVSTITNGKTYYVSTSANASNPTVQITLEADGDGTYYLKNSNGSYIYPNASYSNGFFGLGAGWDYSLGTGKEPVTVSASNTGFTFSRNVTSSSHSTTSYLTLSGSSFGASGSSTTLYLYEQKSGETTTTFTFTGVGEGTTTATVGDTVYTINVSARNNTETKTLALNNSFTLPTGATEINVSGSGVSVSGTTVTATEADKTATVTCVVKNAQGYVTDRYTYTVNTVAEDLSKVSNLTIESWITNAQLGTNSISAQEAYGKDGIVLSAILPENATKESRTLDYWHCRLLDTTLSNSSASGTEKQTGDSGDDDTTSGVSFTKVRYWNSTWSVYTENNEWVSVESKHQLVAYYLEILEVSDELYVNAADWGKKADGSTSGDYLDPKYACTVTIQVVYEDGTTNPLTTDLSAMRSKTIAYGYWTAGRGIGTILLTPLEGFKIYKITAETGEHTYTNSSSTWGSYTVSSFTWDNNPETVFEDANNPVDFYSIHNDSNNPSKDGYYENLMWDENYESILIKVYVKAVAAEDTLSVEYYDMADNNCFYDYNINVAQGTTFDAGFAQSGNGLVNNTVVNYYGVTQTVQSDLSLMPQIGAQYLYAKYTLHHVERSSDGKTVKLYYSFNNTANFVVDFGLPLEFGLKDISANLENANITEVELSGMNYGTAVYNASTKKITYTPNSMLKGNESIGVSITGTITYTDTDGTEKTETKTVSFIVNIVPASTVYYEDSFASFTDGRGSANAAWSIDGTEQTANQLLAVLGNDSNLFGYDAAYANSSTTFSMGSAHKVTVSKQMNEAWNENSAWPYAEFKFKGTGFDLISLTNNDSGIITYEVWKLDANDKPSELVCRKFVNNYYGYSFVGGQWVEAASGDQEALYQIPVVKVSDLEYGSYYVKVTVAYGEVFDLTSDAQYSFWLDGVRVYNTRGDDYANYGEKESYPQFIELHNALVNSGDNYQAVMIEGKEDAELTEYTDYGPNHEVYIANGQSIAFKLNDNLDKIATVQLGAKAVNGSVTFTVTNAKTNVSKEITIDTATDLYYDISEIAKSGDTVIITNDGDNLLSLTTVKVTFSEDVEVTLGMTKTEATAAVMYVRSMFAIPAEPFAPEYLKAKWNTPLAVTGKTATLTVTASEDVEAVCVNGEIIETYKTRTITTGWGSNRTTDTYRVFTYTVTATETADFTVSAFNADGVESDSVTATLYVWGGLGWFKDIIGRLF